MTHSCFCPLIISVFPSLSCTVLGLYAAISSEALEEWMKKSSPESVLASTVNCVNRK